MEKSGHPDKSQIPNKIPSYLLPIWFVLRSGELHSNPCQYWKNPTLTRTTPEENCEKA